MNSESEQTEKLVEKIDTINRIGNKDTLSDEDKNILEIFSFDEESEVRINLAEILAQFSPIFGEEILLRFLEDNDELVRTNACDSLSGSNSLIVLNKLKDRVIRDSSSLVRGYATLSITEIVIRLGVDSQKTISFLRKILNKERTIWVKIHIYQALYLLGDKSYFNQLLDAVNNRLYRNRSVAIKLLKEVATTDNYFIIRSKLSKRLMVEKTLAVKESIEKILSDL